MSKELLKRIKSLLWRAGGIGLIAGLNAFMEGLGATGMSVTLIGILGLIVGEITKFINNKISR